MQIQPTIISTAWELLTYLLLWLALWSTATEMDATEYEAIFIFVMASKTVNTLAVLVAKQNPLLNIYNANTQGTIHKQDIGGMQ